MEHNDIVLVDAKDQGQFFSTTNLYLSWNGTAIAEILDTIFALSKAASSLPTNINVNRCNKYSEKDGIVLI